MADQQPPAGQDRPKLLGKKPEIIVRARITEVDAKKHKDGPVAGIEIQVDFEKVGASNNFLEVWFLYRAVFNHDIGYVALKGLLLLEMPAKRAQSIADNWNNKKEMDQWIAQALLQNVNYKCGCEAMLACKLVDLPSPIVPPPIGVGMNDAQGARVLAQPQGAPQRTAAGPPQPGPPPAQRPMPPPSGPPPAPGAPQGPRPAFNPTFNTPFTGRKPN